MNQSLWNKLAVVVGLFVGFAGIMHFAGPEFFNDIVPPWLPPSQSFWTYLSGVAEIVIAVLLLRPATRRLGALAAVWLFIGVYPANIYMAWDWRNEEISRQFVSYGHLPPGAATRHLKWMHLPVPRVTLPTCPLASIGHD